MKQEEKNKELLLKDLSARLPYGVICKWEDEDKLHKGGGILCDVSKVKTSTGFVYWDCYFEDENDDIPIEIVKPYLRPISSMTDEEKEELYHYYCKEIADNLNTPNLFWELRCCISNSFGTDWLNAHHFDYRGLIDKGLALEAPDDMYDLEKK